MGLSQLWALPEIVLPEKQSIFEIHFLQFIKKHNQFNLDVTRETDQRQYRVQHNESTIAVIHTTPLSDELKIMVGCSSSSDTYFSELFYSWIDEIYPGKARYAHSVDAISLPPVVKLFLQENTNFQFATEFMTGGDAPGQAGGDEPKWAVSQEEAEQILRDHSPKPRKARRERLLNVRNRLNEGYDRQNIINEFYSDMDESNYDRDREILLTCNLIPSKITGHFF
jgi:hypothetical protein